VTFAVLADGENLKYQWYRGTTPVGTNSSTLSISNVSSTDAGSYTVQVKGDCQTLVSDAATLAITTTETPTVTLTADKTLVCQGTTVVFKALGGGTGNNPSYTFRDKNNPIPALQAASTSNTFAAVISQDTEIEVEMVSNSNCIDPLATATVLSSLQVQTIAPATAAITVPIPSIYLTSNTSEILTVTQNTNTTNATYTSNWAILGASTATLSSQSGTVTTRVDNLIENEPVKVEVTVQDQNKLCPAAKDTVTIERKNLTDPSPFEVPDFCLNQLSQTITGPAPMPVIETPSITSNHTGASATQANTNTLVLDNSTAAGTYQATYSIFNSVADVTTAKTDDFTIYALPTQANAGKDTITCTENLTLRGNALTVGTGLWTCDGAVTISNASSPTATISGLQDNQLVTCVWTTSNAICPSTTDQVTILKKGQISSPDMYLNDTKVTGETVDLCITDLQTLRGTTPITADGEQVQWSQVGSSITGVTTTNALHGNLTLAQAGTTTIRYTIQNPSLPACGTPQGTVTIHVFAEPFPTLAVSSLDTCKNVQSIGVQTNTLLATEQGRWVSSLKPKDTLELNTPNWTLAGKDMQAGNNILTWEVENVGCGKRSISETIAITNTSTPSISLVPVALQCLHNQVTINTLVTNQGANASYTWDFDGDSKGAEITASSQFVIDPITQNGKVTVRMASSKRCVTNANVVATLDVRAVAGPKPQLFVAGDSAICVDSPINIRAQDLAVADPLHPTTYTWYKDGNALAESTLTLSNVKESGSYTLQATNGICSQSTSQNALNLTVTQIPIVDASANGINPIEGEEGKELQLSGLHTGTDATWSLQGNASNLTLIADVKDMESLLNTSKGGSYTIELRATDGTCQATDEVELKIRSKIKAPNVFTVNGDGTNESFVIQGIETYPEAKVTIFNRWGYVVYEIPSNYTQSPWDGGNSPAGVYYYTIEFGILNTKNHSGVVHLIR
jgi:gliding motility-associated-like protein